ncbi:MAG: ABC transporter permease [Actinomycetota bacterium]|nr:ABC transporter permease [Actinomycetota bacterium]
MNELFRWEWVVDHLDEVGTRSWEHVFLTLVAVGIGFAISFPLGVYSYRHRRVYGPIAWVAGILYTIPSLALFALLVPFTGLSTTTAEIGLVSYTLLILIRNIVAGLQGVPEDAREAALGMGYSRRQLLWRVEIPLALPVIVAGLRIATVTVIGLVTVTALIGKGGLGYFILLGLERFFSTATILGAALSVLLAVLADRILALAERLLTPWARARV